RHDPRPGPSGTFGPSDPVAEVGDWRWPATATTRGGATMGPWQDVTQDLREPTRSLRHAVPEAWAGFQSLHGAAMADGSVPTATKETRALGTSVAKRCDGCIADHARAAARAGAPAGEVAEILAVALLMDGGTASVYAPRAWEAFQEFAGAARPEAREG